MTASRVAADLRTAAEAPGCAVCSLLGRDEQRFFEILIYEQIGDLSRREQLQHSRGFCAAHMRALCGVEGAPLAAAIIAHSLLGRLLASERLAEAADERPRRRLSTLMRGEQGRSPTALLRPQEPCPACSYLNEQAQLYLTTLQAQLGEESFRSAFSRSDGLCLPHLALALEQPLSAPAQQTLLQQQRAVWQEQWEVLAEFVRKHDYRFKDEPLTSDEQASWRRALQILAGSRQGRDEK